jgi:dTDP-4-amino-4,6-dideoxygalactose transaminase
MAPPTFQAAVAAVPSEAPVTLFDLQRQRLRLEKEIQSRIHTVLTHGQFILGPEVELLEKKLAAFSGAGHVIGVSSGRDALTISLMAMGVGPGDAVFVPSFTFAATAGAVVSIGATPVFVDVDPQSYNMDPYDLEEAIYETETDGRLRPKAVMPVDLYGLPADYLTIGDVASRHGLLLLADAAQSFGASVGNRRVGAIAPITATSFYPTKPLGCYGDGGAILTSDARLAESVRQIRSHGRQGDGDVALQLGLTGRLDTIQAAILLVKLEVFDAELRRRREIARRYDEALGNVAATPKIGAAQESAYAIYTIRVPERAAFRAAMEAAGIGTGLFYRLALHQHPAFAYLPRRPLPVSEQLAREVVSLPVHADLDDDEVDRVITAARAVLH